MHHTLDIVSRPCFDGLSVGVYEQTRVNITPNWCNWFNCVVGGEVLTAAGAQRRQWVTPSEAWNGIKTGTNHENENLLTRI